MYFSALLLYKALVQRKRQVPLYEERILLIEAANEDEALKKAKALAQSDRVSYENEYGEQVTWSVLQVVSITPLMDDTLTTGTELHSRYFRSLDNYRVLEPRAKGEGKAGSS